MSDHIIDFTFGVGRQARSVMAYLDHEPHFATYDSFYYVRIETRPWYNGREGGFVLSMQRMAKEKGEPKYKWLHIAVFEHRNSDNICALKWITDNGYWNHPLEDQNIFETAYGKGASKYDLAHQVGYGEAGKMAKWVFDEMATFYGPKANGK